MFKIVFLFSLLGKFALGADPNVLIKYKSVEIINDENPIMGKWSAVISPGENENSIDINVEIKDTVPQDAVVALEMEKGRERMRFFKFKLCDAIRGVIAGDDLFLSLSPKDKAPKACPIQPASLVIKNYSLNKLFARLGRLKDGMLEFIARLTDANDKPWVTAKIGMEISYGPLIPQLE